MEIEVGQVLWLCVKYQIDKISDVPHPMLVYKINKDNIEVIAMDKTKGKMHALYSEYNIYINCCEPKEQVIYEDSYAQLNTILTIELFPELKKSRKTIGKLSSKKFNDIAINYENWQKHNIVPEQRIVYMTKEDILSMNANL